MSDILQPVVIDNGSGSIKAGFAGDSEPKSCFWNMVGSPKYSRVMLGGISEEKFIGKNAQEHRGLLKLHYPMEKGIIQDWDSMEEIWEHLYRDELGCKPDMHPVLLTESPLNPARNRARMAEVFFETFQVPAMHVSIQAVLSLYASGRVTGVVLDSGDGVTQVVPVYEGYAIPNAIRRMDVAGRCISKNLLLLLRKSGYNFISSSEHEIVRMLKEKMCFVSPNPSKDIKEFLPVYTKQDEYILPDSQVLQLGTERFMAPEILFQPDLIGSEQNGVHSMLNDSISGCDMDLRRMLYGNIVLAGGSTLFKGFGERLIHETKSQLRQRDLKIKICAPPERKYSTWIGGSILASLNSFKKLWVTMDEYQEDPEIIHK